MPILSHLPCSAAEVVQSSTVAICLQEGGHITGNTSAVGQSTTVLYYTSN